MNQLISVIVPCYNQAQYLDECLQSVLDQTYQDWECIIVNDGSPDNTEEVAKNWVEKDSRFKYFYKENRGLSSARNLGIEKSIGKYLFFLDSDDWLASPNTFNTFINYLQVDSTIEVIVGNLQEIRIEGIKPSSLLNNKIQENTVLDKERIFDYFLKQKFSVIACNKLILKDVLTKNKIIFKDKIFHEDELFTFTMLIFLKKVLLIKDITYTYNRINLNSITQVQNPKRYADKIDILKENLFSIKRHDLLAVTDPDLFIDYFKTNSHGILGLESISFNRKRFIKVFSELRKIYRDSVLSNHRKLFIYSPLTSFYIHRIRLNKSTNVAALIAKKLLKKSNVI